MNTKTTRTYNEQLLEIRDLYRESGLPWPATTRQIAMWAIQQGHYERHNDKLIAKAAEEFATAMRDEHYTDPQGRRVRLMHAARAGRKKGESADQRMLWDDIRSATRGFMERAFQQRRRGIVGDCKQLKTDVDSFNENRPEEKPIQLILDFTFDVMESEQPSMYRPGKPR